MRDDFHRSEGAVKKVVGALGCVQYSAIQYSVVCVCTSIGFPAKVCARCAHRVFGRCGLWGRSGGAGFGKAALRRERGVLEDCSVRPRVASGHAAYRVRLERSQCNTRPGFPEASRPCFACAHGAQYRTAHARRQEPDSNWVSVVPEKTTTPPPKDINMTHTVHDLRYSTVLTVLAICC